MDADILNRFDVLIDCPSARISFATEQIEYPGNTLTTDEFMGIPVIDVTVANVPHRMFFDTGAQISYFQPDDRLSMKPDDYIGPCKERRIVNGRALICYWAVRELEVSMTQVAEHLKLAVLKVSAAGKNGEKSASRNELVWSRLLNLEI